MNSIQRSSKGEIVNDLAIWVISQLVPIRPRGIGRYKRMRTETNDVRLGADGRSAPTIMILDLALMDPPECRFSWVDIRPQSILEPVRISSALEGFRRPRNHLDWARRCPRFSSTPVWFPPAH